MSPRQEIAALDKQINANRANLKDARLEIYLFRQRGLAQGRLDDESAARRLAAARAMRMPKAKKCPTCGAHTLYATT